MSSDPKAEETKNLGNDHYKKGNYNEAIKCYTESIEISPSTAAYYGNRAAALMMKNSWKEALDDSLKAISIDPKFVKGYVRAGKCYIQLGKLKESKELYASALKQLPNNAEIITEEKALTRVEGQMKSANEALEAKSYSMALRDAEAVLASASTLAPAKLIKAHALLGLKQYSTALNILGDIIRENSNNPEALYLRGLALYYQNNTAQAINHFTHALTLDPDFSEARVSLKMVRSLEAKKKEGNDAFQKGANEEAVAAYTEALAVDPYNISFNSTLYANRAAAYSKLGKNQEALDDCTRALDLDPNYLKAILRRAQIYMTLEKYEDAVRDYEKAHQMDEENADTVNRLRNAKLELKKSLRKDYYKILQVSKDASDDEIKKSYRKLALKYHPDKNQEGTEEEKLTAEKTFKDIGEAYSILSDPTKRRRFDSGQDLEGGMGGGFPGGADGVDVNQIFQMFFGGGMGGGGGGMGGMGGMGGGGMGGGGRRRGRNPHSFGFE